MEVVTGYVEHIVFRNEENGYTVFNLDSEDGEVTCVGSFHYINEGEMLEVQGDYVNHSVYGSQLKVNSHKVKEPEDRSHSGFPVLFLTGLLFLLTGSCTGR